MGSGAAQPYFPGLIEFKIDYVVLYFFLGGEGGAYSLLCNLFPIDTVLHAYRYPIDVAMVNVQISSVLDRLSFFDCWRFFLMSMLKIIYPLSLLLYYLLSSLFYLFIFRLVQVFHLSFTFFYLVFLSLELCILSMLLAFLLMFHFELLTSCKRLYLSLTT